LRGMEAVTSRRFPAPWRADKITGGYVVRDANGQALARIYSDIRIGRWISDTVRYRMLGRLLSGRLSF
jgi:hypothetical protein